MSDLLLEIHKLLDDFENELSDIRAIWRQFESEENWQENRARMWLHGATNILDRNELEQWLFDHPPLSNTAQIPAKKVHSAWRKWLETKGSLGAYYVDFREFQIPQPKKDELLIHFVIRLAQSVEDDGKGHRLEWRALKSFLGFIRKLYPIEEVAFVEHIFPKKMSLHFGSIIRMIPPEAYPIPEKTASEILIELARRCRHGRPDARLTAAESMGLCWLCITASRIRLPTHIEMIKKIKLAAVQPGSDLPILQVPTWFGDRPIKISHRVANFFNALARVPSKKPRETILQRPFRSLTRTFDTALKNVAPKPKYGTITYVTLLSHPHHFGDHRTQPK